MDDRGADVPEHSGGPHGLADIVSPQVRALLERRSVDVFVPLGALEQHGPHLPLATDTIIAEAVAREVASSVDDLVVAPCLPVGCSDHHLAFAGTASIPNAVAAAYVSAVTSTLLGHGFRCAYLWSAHAGNNDAVREAAASLSDEFPGRVAAFVDWPAQRRRLHEWAEAAFGLAPERVGSHAGHFETSIMLAVAPDGVDMEAAPEGFVGPVQEAADRMKRDGIAALSDVGVIGDARSATAEAGKGYLKVLVATLLSFIEARRAAAAASDG